MIKIPLNEILSVFDDIKTQNIDSDIQAKCTDFCWGTGEKCIVLAANKKYFQQAINNSNVICIIAPEVISQTDKAVITTNRFDDLFHYIHNTYFSTKELITHYVSPTASISENAVICPPVHIGHNTTICSGAYIGKNTVLNDGAYIAQNCTISTEGMLAKSINGIKKHITHYGSVIIGKGCYIHANSNISKGLFYSGKTLIGDYCHIGIGVNIAHDVVIGQSTEISGNSNIAGRSTIGSDVWIGANCTISNWVKIGDKAKVRIGSTVVSDIPEKADVSGNFAIKHTINLRKFIEDQAN
ncbi:DapH/DapD/GlmU-related protein [uncultured Pseudoalteromonas sp.]|uniref:DapH/DapD/GlmU-related protein n=1 Tax=uncultured Pseudoalteromonas sp. TaxID=114053 RepID=UPI0026041BB5|nr:DapH/DapD/GlmU-related protein [uncultured Pseudoalteromonas sp.]